LFIGKITIFEVQLDGIPEVDDVVYPKPQENVLHGGVGEWLNPTVC
jgi:hypothetical protein